MIKNELLEGKLIRKTNSMLGKVSRVVNYNCLTNYLENRFEKIVKNVLEKDEYLQGKLDRVENLKYDYIEVNDIDGLDYINTLELDKIDFKGLVTDREEKISLLEKYMNDCSIYMAEVSKNDYYDGDLKLVMSTCDEIFVDVRSENIVYFPFIKGEESTQNFENDFDLFVKTELNMQKVGAYSNIIDLDYYGNFYTFHTFSNKYDILRTAQTNDEKGKVHALEVLDRLFKYIGDEEKLQLDELDLFEDYLPSIVKKLKIAYSHTNIDIIIDKMYINEDMTMKLKLLIDTSNIKLNVDKINAENEDVHAYTTTFYKSDYSYIDLELDLHTILIAYLK